MLNGKLLSRQGLSVPRHKRKSVEQIAESCCGINSQNFSDSLVSFWARHSSFKDSDLLTEFRPHGKLSRTWTVRGTVHTFPSKDYYVHVFGSPRDRALKAHDRYAGQLGLPEREKRIDRLYRPLLDELKGISVSSGFIGEFISARLDEMGIKGKRKLTRGWTSEARYGPTWDGLMEMSYLGLITNSGRNGSANLWMRTADWLPGKMKEQSPTECAASLIRSYIENYGPVTLNDIVYWTGHRVRDVKAALDDLEGHLVIEQGAGRDSPHYSIESGENAWPDPPKVVILPRFDSAMMAYRYKERIIPESLQDSVSVKSGIINPTILLDGFVAGTWRKEKKGKGIAISLSMQRKPGKQGVRAIKSEFELLSSYFDTDISITV